MKNKVILFIFAMLAMSQISFGQNRGSSAQTFSQDYLTFTIKDGNVVVTSCSKEATGEIIIPEMVSFKSEKYPVTGIGKKAFIENKSIVSVSIPNSVTTIGELAFCGCTGLSSVSIPNSVSNIGKGAFNDCNGLVSIVVESGNSVYDSRNNCNAIIHTATNELIRGCQNTVIPGTVKSIGNQAFFYCKNLTSVNIPNSVTNIGNDAFYFCKLDSVLIPNSVVTIGDGAFRDCGGNKIIVPKSVAKIGKSAFLGVSCIYYDGELEGAPWGAQKWENPSLPQMDKPQIKTIEQYLYYYHIKATPTPSGLYIIVNNKGRSPNKVTQYSKVTVNYVIRLLDGTIVDCTDKDLAKQSLTYDPYRQYVPHRYIVGKRPYQIEGWEEGIMNQTEGARITLIIPPNLAFGEVGWKPYIAPNTPVIVELSILEVVNARK